MKIPILLYHSINENSSPHFNRWTMKPQLFDAHMAYLLEHDYTPVALADIVNAICYPNVRLPKRPVGITFDDGFEDFYLNALPILTKYQIPSTVYVVTGFIGETSRWLEGEGEGAHRMMNWKQISAIAEAGVDVGAHTLHHYHLDTLRRDVAYHEITGSKEMLEKHLGQTVTSFAYPHGYHSKEITLMVKLAGFVSACAVKHGLSSTADNPYALARVIVNGDAGPRELGALLEGKGLYPVSGDERLRTKVWRMVRRMLFRLRGVELPHNIPSGGEPIYGNPTDQH